MTIRRPLMFAGIGVASGALAVTLLAAVLPARPPVVPAVLSSEAPVITGPRSASRPTSPHGNPAVQNASLETGDAGDLKTRRLKVQRGDTLMGMLVEAGVDRQEAHSSIEAVRDVYDPKELRPGDEVTLTFVAGEQDGPQFRGFSLEPEPARTVLASRDDQGGFSASEVRGEVKEHVVRYEGEINTSLFVDATRIGVPPQVLATMIEIFSYDVDFQRDFQPGDHFEVLFERSESEDGQTVGDMQLTYASLTLSGQKMPLYRFEDDSGHVDFYNEKGHGVRKALLRTPINGARLSSGFGMRHHPILGYSKMHKGVDFAAPTGTPIYAAGDGVVEMAQNYMGYGNYVRLRHTSEYSTAYGHMSAFARGMKAGRKVQQGEVIGYVGTTGRSTGPHLHYEILQKNAQVNPLNVRFPSGRELAGKELKKFQELRKRDDSVYVSLPANESVRRDTVAALQEKR